MFGDNGLEGDQETFGSPCSDVLSCYNTGSVPFTASSILGVVVFVDPSYQTGIPLRRVRIGEGCCLTQRAWGLKPGTWPTVQELKIEMCRLEGIDTSAIRCFNQIRSSSLVCVAFFYLAVPKVGAVSCQCGEPPETVQRGRRGIFGKDARRTVHSTVV